MTCQKYRRMGFSVSSNRKKPNASSTDLDKIMIHNSKFGQDNNKKNFVLNKTHFRSSPPNLYQKASPSFS